jgi:hypothetical protein
MSGSLTRTIFKKTEKKLMDNLEYQRSLKFVARRKNMEKYRCIIDFLFAETFPEPWKFKCFRYYNGCGCQIKDDPDITPSEIKAYDEILCNVVLELAYQMHIKCLEKEWKEKSVSWTTLQNTVHQLLSA